MSVERNEVRRQTASHDVAAVREVAHRECLLGPRLERLPAPGTDAKRTRPVRLLGLVLAAVVAAQILVADGQDPSVSTAVRTPRIAIVGDPTAPWHPPVLGQGDPGVAVASRTLLFEQGQTKIALRAAGPNVYWAVQDLNGTELATGATEHDDNVAEVDLRDLGSGFYYLSAATSPEAAPDHRTTVSFGVLPPFPDRANRSRPFGVGVHLPAVTDPTTLAHTITTLGFGYTRFDVDWSLAETTPGKYTFPSYTDDFVAELRDAGVAPLVVADYGHPSYDGGRTPSSPEAIHAYTRFATAVMDHYEPSVNRIEIYNEFNSIRFNNGTCGRTPECYSTLLDATATAIRSRWPYADVVAGATSGLPLDWLEGLFAVGGMRSMSSVSIHPYIYPYPPEELIDDLSRLRSLISRYTSDDAFPILVTEIGWPTGRSHAVPETTQADYLVRAESIALASGVRELHWYDLIDDGRNLDNVEDNFGLLYGPTPGVAALMPKPSAVAQGVIARQLAGLRFLEAEAWSPETYVLHFGDGTTNVRVMWATTRPAMINVTGGQTLDLCDEYGRCQELGPHSGGTRIQLNEHPVVLKGDAESITSIV